MAVVPSAITRPKIVEVDPLIVRLFVPVPLALLTMEPVPPVFEASEAMVWLKPLRSSLCPFPLEKPMVTAVEVGSASFTPNFTDPVAVPLKKVAPV